MNNLQSVPTFTLATHLEIKAAACLTATRVRLDISRITSARSILVDFVNHAQIDTFLQILADANINATCYVNGTQVRIPYRIKH